MICPNKNDSIYKKMLSKYGDDIAMQIFITNNNNIPNSLIGADNIFKGIAKKIELVSNNNSELLSKKINVIPHIVEGISTDNINESKLSPQFKQLADNFKKSFSNQKIIYVNTDSENNLYPKLPMYFANGDLYINTDIAKPEHFLHESMHLFLDKIKFTNPELYQRFVDLAQSHVDSKSFLYDFVKNNYPNSSDDDIREEIVCFLMEQTTMNKIESNFTNNNESQLIFENISDKVGDVYNSVKNYLKGITNITGTISNLDKLDFSKASIGQIMDALADDILTGRFVSGLKSETFIGVLKARVATTKNDIYDLNNYLREGNMVVDWDSRYEKFGIEQKLSYIRQNNYKYDLYGIEEDYSGLKNNEDAIRKKIKEDIIPRVDNYIDLNKGKLIEFLKSNNYIKGKEIFYDVKLQKSRYDVDTLSNIVNSIGYVEDACLLSELGSKGINIDVPGMIGYDPIVIFKNVVKDSSGKITRAELSLFDFTSTAIGGEITGSKGKNILTNFISNDIKAHKMGITYKANNINIRKLMMGYNLIAIKNANQNIQITRTGVVSLFNKQMKVEYFNGNEAIYNAAIASTVQGVADVIGKPIADISKKFTTNDITIEQDYIQMLHDMVDVNENTSNYYFKKDLATYINERDARKISPEATEKIINRLRIKQKQLIANNDSEEMVKYLTNAIASLQGMSNIKVKINSFESLRTDQKLFTNIHNIANPVLQWITNRIKNSHDTIVTKTRKWKDEFDTYLQPVYDTYINSGVQFVGRKLSDVGSKAFDQLIKRETLDDGSIVRLNKIYWKESDIGTNNNGKILNAQDIKLGRKIIDDIEHYLIMLEMHRHKFDKNFTNEDAKKIVLNKWDKEGGAIPVLEKSVAEMIFTRNAGEAFSHFFKQQKDNNYMFSDIVEKGKRDEVTFFFDKQFSSSIDNNITTLKMIGLNIDDNGKKILQNKGLNEQMSSNMEKIMGSFVENIIRKIEYEDNVLDNVKDSEILLHAASLDYGEDQKNALDLLKIYADAMIAGHGVTFDEEKSPVMNTMHTIAKTILRVVSFNGMALSIPLMVANKVQNELVTFTNTMAATTFKDTGYGMAKADEMYKANAIMYTDRKKAYAIARQLHLIDSDEQDILTNHSNLVTNEHMWSGNFFFAHMRYTDRNKKTMYMVAQMIKDGTWDAYTYKNGDLKYDIKKDKRFYDVNGNLTGPGKALMETIKTRMKDQALLDDSGNMIQPYDNEGMRNILWITNKWVTGTYDMKNGVAFDEMLQGQFYLQFRSWFTDAWFNHFGNFSSISNPNKKKYSNEGGKDVVYQDPVTKEYYTKREMPLIEGQFTTVIKYFADVMNVYDSNLSFRNNRNKITPVSIGKGIGKLLLSSPKIFSPSNNKIAWNKLTPEQKFNIGRQTWEFILFTTCMLLYNGLVDDKKDKEDNDHWIQEMRFVKAVKYGIMDLIPVVPSSLFKMISEPIPAANQIKRIYDIIFMGKDDKATIGRTLPGSGTYMVGSELWSLLDKELDNE